MMGPLLLSVVVAVVAAPSKSGIDGKADGNLDRSSDQVERTLDEVLASCEKALGPLECTSVDGGEDAWRALVVFSEDGAKVTLSRANRVIVRSLEFLPEDSEKQRRVAAGLLVAAMTAAARLSEPNIKEATDAQVDGKEEPARPDEAATAPKDPPADLPESPFQGGGVTLELAAIAGSTLGGLHFGAGGLAAVTTQIRRHIGIGVGVDGLYSRYDGWEVLTVQGGVGPRIALLTETTAGSWQLAAEATIDVTQIRYAHGEDSFESAIRGGGRVRTSFALGSKAVRPLLGVGVSALSPLLELRQNGSVVRVVPSFLGCAFVGIAYK